MRAVLRANVLFRNFQPQSPSDLTLAYLTVYVGELLRLFSKCKTKEEAKKAMTAVSMSTSFAIPGDKQFVLPGFFQQPASRQGGRGVPELHAAGARRQPYDWWSSHSPLRPPSVQRPPPPPRPRRRRHSRPRTRLRTNVRPASHTATRHMPHATSPPATHPVTVRFCAVRVA